jgi:uncharacterized protein YgiM (DUF1202 family)
VLLAALLLAASLGAIAGAQRSVDAAWGATVATDAVNLRSEPGTWAEVVGGVGYGAWVEIYQGPSDGWYEVGYDGIVGWVDGVHLALDGESGSEAAATGADGAGAMAGVGGVSDGGETAWVATDALAVRASADPTGAILETFYYGTEVTVLGDVLNGYVPVALWGGLAWVSVDYLSWDGTSSAAAASAESGDAAPAAGGGTGRWIDVDRSSGIVTLNEGGWAVAQFWGAMGWDQSDDGFFATANGTYYVYAKERGLTWTDWGKTFVRFFVAFDPARANGFHSYSLDGSGNVLPGGANATGGCVALMPAFAEALFDFAEVGTRVEVHW